MARLCESDEAEEFPELSVLLQSVVPNRIGLYSDKAVSVRLGKEQGTLKEPPKKSRENILNTPVAEHDCLKQSNEDSFKETQKIKVGKQKPLRLAHIDSLLLPIPNRVTKSHQKLQETPTKQDRGDAGVIKKPRKQKEQNFSFGRFDSQILDTLTLSEDENQSTLSDIILEDSTSDLKNKTLGSNQEQYQRSSRHFKPIGDEARQAGKWLHYPRIEPSPQVVDIVSPIKPSEPFLDKQPRKEALENTREHENALTEDTNATLSLYDFPQCLSLLASLTEIQYTLKIKISW